MKVRVEFTIDIDPEAWAEEYGVERSEVREDVKQHFVSDAFMSAADLGVLIR